MTDTVERPLATRPADPPPGPPSLSASELARWAWRQLTSMRTALILLLLLMLAAIPGSLVPQTRVDPRAVALWKKAHPSLTPAYDRLGLFGVYGSVWFSAIYILLMVSLVGCILPRLRIYWRAATAPPPRAPRNLRRLPAAASMTTAASAEDVARAARQLLKRQHYRVVTTAGDGQVTVSAQRGYLREAGNLVFHLSLVVVLVSFAVGNLFGFRGGVIVVAGQTFTDTRQSYDDFAPGALFRERDLPPFSLTLDSFTARFKAAGPTMGQPTLFRANTSYRTGPGEPRRQQAVQVNKPLDIEGVSVFLIGNGYAPVITVRDGQGKVVYSGPTIFLPENSTYASWGVLKVPDAQPTQLGFEGRFLPTYASSKATGPVSRFPQPLAPTLSLKAFSGDLGLGSGVPQSVYALSKGNLKTVVGRDGKPLTLTIPMGTTRRLPGGLGTVTFDGLRRWTRLQLSSTPAERFALGGVVIGLLGLLASLFIRPRRIWLRARTTATGADVEAAGLDRLEGRDLQDALDVLLLDLGKALA